jgi:16S rRNA (guanine527-N7)-methyltransferase
MTGERELFFSLVLQHLEGVYQPTSSELAALYGHYGILDKWNRKLNLTAIRTLADIVVRHYCESVFLATHLGPECSSVVDIGSGAGFPGVPIAILRPDVRTFLVESHRRKAVFLREATRELSNCDVIASRAEEFHTGCDFVVSRAVSPLGVLATVPRLSRSIALLVGSEGAAEVRNRGELVWTTDTILPWGKRRVLLVGSAKQ